MFTQKQIMLAAAMTAALFTCSYADVPGRITISGNEFQVCGKRIWMAGANTPWKNWNDFGGNYTPDFWDTHFALFNANGLNATRVWISCSGEVGIKIDDDGYVNGATDAHWKDLDSYFALAKKHGVYVMATLISFDHFKDKYTTFQKWRNWINSDKNIDSYINNYLIPFLKRYGTNEALWSIDMTNEPEWATKGEGGTIEWDRFQKFWAKAAKAIHKNSRVLVTVGIGVIKYNADGIGMNGNKVGDSALQAQEQDKQAKLDFYSPHWYSWMDPYWPQMMYSTPGFFGIGDRPCVIGECSANGQTGHTLAEDYESAYKNGWQGLIPWTSNHIDGNGGWEQVQPAGLSFLKNHKELVLPVCDVSKASTPAEVTQTPVQGK
jgi:hypothetical protein